LFYDLNKKTAIAYIYPNTFFYGKESFLSKESDTEILQSIYFAYDVGIISSYSNRTFLISLHNAG